MHGNSVTDLAPLTGLDELRWLNAHDNAITDLGPLVENPALGLGVRVHVRGNRLDCSEQSRQIQTLVDRGVFVESDCE